MLIGWKKEMFIILFGNEKNAKKAAAMGDAYVYEQIDFFIKTWGKETPLFEKDLITTNSARSFFAALANVERAYYGTMLFERYDKKIFKKSKVKPSVLYAQFENAKGGYVTAFLQRYFEGADKSKKSRLSALKKFKNQMTAEQWKLAVALAG